MSDAEWIRRCLELAARGAGKTSPNPMVGAVVVDPRGRIVGEGYHRRAGGRHAEVEALRKAGKKARGATLYSNLEPCSHHGRTPPCAPQILDAGIARVVYGLKDPIRSHAGGGRWLSRHGVDVAGGVLAGECRELNRAFVTWAVHQRPYFVAKVAMTLDGKIATRSGQSKWITGGESRKDGHRLRSALDGIMVGIGTVLADDPQLTVRPKRGRDPIRIIVDSTLRTPPTAAVLPAQSTSSARCIIATTSRAPAARERRLTAAGAEVWRISGRGKTVDLARLARRLAEIEVVSVLVEGGAELHASALSAGLVDELRLYVAPKAVGGGPGAPSWLAGKGAASLEKAWEFQFVGNPVALGSDVLLVARPKARRRR